MRNIPDNNLLGSLLVVTVVGAPIGLGLIQLSQFLMKPFSDVMITKKSLKVEQNQAWSAYGMIVRIVYFPVGLILAAITIVQICLLVFTIVGIPLALILAKSLRTFINPVDKVCVSHAMAEEIVFRLAKEAVDSYA